jgi:hypothetical protein
MVQPNLLLGQELNGSIYSQFLSVSMYSEYSVVTRSAIRTRRAASESRAC